MRVRTNGKKTFFQYFKDSLFSPKRRHTTNLIPIELRVPSK